MRYGQLDPIVSPGAKEPTLEVDRCAVRGRPAALRVQQERVAHVFEREVFLVVERVDRGIPARTGAAPRAEEERQRLDLRQQRTRNEVAHRFHGATLPRASAAPGGRWNG